MWLGIAGIRAAARSAVQHMPAELVQKGEQHMYHRLMHRITEIATSSVPTDEGQHELYRSALAGPSSLLISHVSAGPRLASLPSPGSRLEGHLSPCPTLVALLIRLGVRGD